MLLANAILLSLFTFGCNSVRHLVGGQLDCFTCSARARRGHRLWRGVGVLNGRHMEWAWISLIWVALADLYVRLAAGGVVRRSEDHLSGGRAHDYDVVVIGAGGAGLRAAIAAAEAGARTALVCKSLLGKAHTVMAEGGVAASLGNVAPEDNWQVHFQDTMFGGKYLNNWRMAELHARGARTACASSSGGAASSTARPTARCRSARSAGTRTSGSCTSATAPASS